MRVSHGRLRLAGATVARSSDGFPTLERLYRHVQPMLRRLEADGKRLEAWLGSEIRRDGGCIPHDAVHRLSHVS